MVYWFNGLIFTKGLVVCEVICTNDVYCGGTYLFNGVMYTKDLV